MKIRTYLAAAGLLWLGACSPSGAETGHEAHDNAPMSGVRSELLVSGDWLAGHLDDPDVVVLHVAPDRSAYDRGHIPGARFLPLSAIVVERDGLPNELPPVEHLDSVFEAVGVSDGTRVVVYGPPLAAARAFVTLDYLGHGDRTALLDGGLERWVAEGRPLSTEAPEVARGRFTPRPRPELVVDAAWVAARLDSPGIALLDARPEAEFAGDVAGAGIPRPGHIPGARNVFWQRMIRSPEDPTFLEPDTLRALLADAGVEPGDTVVAYCRTGVQASVAYFVARYLGYEARMYDGSFIDWSPREALRVER
jgi:thiosulfate/3-mercaptopyruvate sulfurtransferase